MKIFSFFSIIIFTLEIFSDSNWWFCNLFSNSNLIFTVKYFIPCWGYFCLHPSPRLLLLLTEIVSDLTETISYVIDTISLLSFFLFLVFWSDLVEKSTDKRVKKPRIGEGLFKFFKNWPVCFQFYNWNGMLLLRHATFLHKFFRPPSLSA